MPGKHGGARPGAGRKPGTPNKVPQTIRRTVAEAAAAYTEEALETLADVMRNGRSDAARVSAAVSLLDRAHGKAGIAEGQADEEAVSLAVTISTAPAVADIRVTRTDG